MKKQFIATIAKRRTTMVQKIRKDQKQKNMMAAACVTAVLMMSLMVGPAQATPLNLNLMSYPDINSIAIATTYDYLLDEFIADGFAAELNPDGSSLQTIYHGDFLLTASINSTGYFSSGTLVIEGSFVDANSPFTLLEGDLTAFGYGSTSDYPFEFLFDVTGGDDYVVGLYGGIGSTGGVILSAVSSTFDGNFDGDFGGTYISDTAPVPEPSTILLMGIGLAGLVGLRRKKIKN